MKKMLKSLLIYLCFLFLTIIVLYTNIENPFLEPGTNILGVYITENIFFYVEFVPAFFAGMVSVLFFLYIIELIDLKLRILFDFLVSVFLSIIPMIMIQGLIDNFHYLEINLLYFISGIIYSVVIFLLNKIQTS
jgi:hypothetical protein